MKKQNAANTIFVVITILAVACVFWYAFAYEPFLDQIDRSPNGGDFYPEDYYQINPNTIISSLDRGESNVFTPLTINSPEKYWLENNWPESDKYIPGHQSVTSLEWHQPDFAKIATAINQFAGKDQFADWDFAQVNFDTQCENYSDGFSDGYFVIYKPYWRKGQLYFQAREIYISSDLNIVRWGHGRSYPRPILGWEGVNFDQFMISADEALLIAEENGGSQVRTENGNDCNIAVIGHHATWVVLYSPYARYEIDSYTGKIVSILEY